MSGPANRRGRPALVAVAHGSRDPRSAATVSALMRMVRDLRPDLDVRLGFLDRSAPRLPDVLAAVAGDGHRRAVVVPLLLGHAFHAGVDLPAALRRAARRHPALEVTTAGVLGGHPGLAAAALRRLAGSGFPLPDRGLGVVLAAVGSSHAPANAAVARIAACWTGPSGCAGATAAFATTSAPSVPAAVAALRTRGALRVAVAPWVLAPGLLADRIAAAALEAGAAVAPVLGADPGVAAAVLDRYAATAAVTTAAAG